MKANLIKTIFVMAVVAVTVQQADAAENYCITPGTKTIDRAATTSYRQLERTATPATMRLMTGVWASSVNSPQTGQTSYLYEVFEANGLYRYFNSVCARLGCTQYQGVGLYALRAQPNNGFLGAKIVSDLNRDHACLGLSGRFLNVNAWVSPSGLVSQRIR